MSPQRDRGAGLVTTVTGVLVFLALVSLSTQLLVSLYARTVVTSVAYDAVRAVATSTDPSGASEQADITRAERTARELLGRTGARATFSWRIDREAVRLRVRAPVPRLTLLPIRGLAGLTEVERTVEVRLERFR